MKHKYLKHENCKEINCNICDGGLTLCTVCNCGEGELATECPGYDINKLARQLIYDGLMDYKEGDWIYKNRHKKEPFEQWIEKQDNYETIK
jgi:hypothetical protein